MPDSSLTIVISAADKSSKILNDIQRELDDTRQSLNHLATATDKVSVAQAKNIAKTNGIKKAWGDFRSQVPGLNSALNLLTNPITLVAAGLAATAKIMKDSVKETIAYADQVRDLSRSLGTTAEESSKLIQVADDLFVSYGTLTVAMKTAQRQGINPNIEGLMGLAEKYQALKDPAERAAFALKTFGRSGLEMTKILEKTPDQLKAMGDALEGSNLIMSQDSVDAAYKYKQAMDELGDTWQGLKYQIGTSLIPALTEATKGFATHAGATISLLNAAKSGKITWGEYIAQSAKVTWSAYNAADAQAWLTRKLAEQRAGIIQSTGASDGFIQRMAQLATTEEEAAEATEFFNKISLATPPNIKAAADALGKYSDTAEEIERRNKRLALAQDLVNQSMSDLSTMVSGTLGPDLEDFNETQAGLYDEAEKLRSKISELEAKKYLTDAQREELDANKTKLGEIGDQITQNADDHEQATKRILFDMLVQRAAIDGTSTAEAAFLLKVAEGYGLIDEATATSMKAADEAMLGLAYGAGFAEVISKFETANGLVGGISSKLNGMNGKTFETNLVINVRQSGGGVNIQGGQFTTSGGGGGGGAPAPTGGPPRGTPGFRGARGLDMTVPAGYPNDSAIYRATSGERVTITPANQVTNNNNNRQTMTMNIITNAPVSTLLRDYRMMQARAG